MLRQYLEQRLRACLVELYQELPRQQLEKLAQIERTDPQHGDFSANAAMALARPLRQKPLDIATRICQSIKPDQHIEQVSVAPPGFINFRMHDSVIAAQCAQISNNENYGCSEYGAGKRILLECVSANPTGPLHIGHGRSAAFGDILARMLRTCGYSVDTEYYVNDAGRQIDILGTCVWLRYLHLGGYQNCCPYPDRGYQGDYINDIATKMVDMHGDAAWPESACWPSEEPDGEPYLDALISLARKQSLYTSFCKTALEIILEDIKEDLELFTAAPQRWFSELGLFASGEVATTLQLLSDSKHTEKRDGAIWFLASSLGDEKDRVLVRASGQETYFLSDIAYHLNKYRRNYDLVLNIWGADHHGYVPRLKAALAACGEDPGKIEIILLQFVSLRNAGTQVSMSTRSGQYLSLRSLHTTAGKDAARFFYVMRKGEQHLEFDLKLAQSQSNDNPVYYVQYAHARICSILRNADLHIPDWRSSDQTFMEKLTLPSERMLMMELLSFPDTIIDATLRREPHRLTYCLRDLATLFHSYYTETTVLHETRELCIARLTLMGTLQTVLRRGLSILSVTAPEKM